MENLKERIEDYFSQVQYRGDDETTQSLKPDFIRYLGLIDHTNDEDFTTAVRIATDHYVQKYELSREIGTSKPTVERWIEGKNTPHPAMRPAVIEWIIEKLQE
ncbi:hypothetical protein GOV03_02480 [Candidatus Woesearchaeota archaeon]|nr:hypothetical protein [Candidatus Woesearchaeota archaeon]